MCIRDSFFCQTDASLQVGVGISIPSFHFFDGGIQEILACREEGGDGLLRACRCLLYTSNLDLGIDKEVFTALLKEYHSQVDSTYLPELYQPIATEYGGNERTDVYKRQIVASVPCLATSDSLITNH